MAETSTEQHNLPGARQALTDAISGLVEPKAETHDNKIVWTDSLYQQLADSIPGSKRERTGAARSQPPIWIDAAMLLRKIDTQIARWERRWPVVILNGQILDEYPTILRLRCINARKWRPQDTNTVLDIAAHLLALTNDINNLLNEKHAWDLIAPCPACNTQTIHRKDTAGENVRQPALQITATGCECMNCHTYWGAERFQLLAAVLGCPLPTGVLE